MQAALTSRTCKITLEQSKDYCLEDQVQTPTCAENKARELGLRTIFPRPFHGDLGVEEEHLPMSSLYTRVED